MPTIVNRVAYSNEDTLDYLKFGLNIETISKSNHLKFMVLI